MTVVTHLKSCFHYEWVFDAKLSLEEFFKMVRIRKLQVRVGIDGRRVSRLRIYGAGVEPTFFEREL